MDHMALQGQEVSCSAVTKSIGGGWVGGGGGGGGGVLEGWSKVNVDRTLMGACGLLLLGRA